MKRVFVSLALAALGCVLVTQLLHAQSCSIGGHNETSENFGAAVGSWGALNRSPGTVSGGVTGTHLLISEVAPQGASGGAGSDSSEYIEIYNPTSRPIFMGNKYLSDDPGYYRIVFSFTHAVANSNDYVLRFPSVTLDPGRTIVICVTKAGWTGSGASPPAAAQYFLEMQNSNGNPADDMINVATGSAFPVAGGMMTNPGGTDGEWIALFVWDGALDRVCDLDYASFGANSVANPKLNKTGLSADGPDTGFVFSTYYFDTNAASQSNLGSGAALVRPNTYQRVASEVGETAVGGNGCVVRAMPTVSWVPVDSGTPGFPNIRFKIRWTNPDADETTGSFSGTLSSQHFGALLTNYAQIGPFSVPAIAPQSFHDVFLESSLASLPPPPEKSEAGVTNVCVPDTNWAGNVYFDWFGNGQGDEFARHYSDLRNCNTGLPSYIRLRANACMGSSQWTVSGGGLGWSARLVGEDFLPAPSTLPQGWSGWIEVRAFASVPEGSHACFVFTFVCGSWEGRIDVCSSACDCSSVVEPVLTAVDWVTNGSVVKVRQRWENPALVPSEPVSGNTSSQEFGVFLPNYGPIGPFNVPAIQPGQFLDVFTDVLISALPPNPQIEVPGPNPGPGQPCYYDNRWHGNVDVSWNGPSGSGSVNKHFGEVPVCANSGPTLLFVETGCSGPASWSVLGACPGLTVTLLDQNLSPAPNPVPPGWVGRIAVYGTPQVVGTTCCFQVRFVCNTEVGVIDVCAYGCGCSTTDAPLVTHGVDFGIYSAAPNPALAEMAITFATARASIAKLEIYDANGQRVRTLLDGPASAGMNSVRWDGRGENGRRLPPGAYFVILKSGERVAQKKIVMIR